VDKSKINVTPVILSGGSGSRLWPLSRAEFPKQFLNLTEKLSLFQLTANRIKDLASDIFKVNPMIVVSGDDHRFIVRAQLSEIKLKNSMILLEPCPKNTAPALTLAALANIEKYSDSVLVMMPSDQIVFDNEVFKRAISTAINAANEGSIVILGIKPNSPDTGFGYIKANVNSDNKICSVTNFIEKPVKEKAEEYYKNDGFFWNSGIFVLKSSVWLSAIENYHAEIAEKTKLSWNNRKNDLALGDEFIRVSPEDFEKIPSQSIDYAVMENITNSEFDLKMVSLENSGWSDLGAWDSVWNSNSKDEDGNAATGDVFLIDSKDTLVHSNSRFVSVLGVNNMAIIETADAVLIADREKSQDVKKVVNFLNDSKRQEAQIHRKVHRPWGYYDLINQGENYKVKLIGVNPGASLSLQKHLHRSEHWVVIKGIAEVVRDDNKEILRENCSIYIAAGQIHRLSNPSNEILEIIEIQTGKYLGEDDIERLEDNYGR
jgi:mannose-1-phosphate guanylyltransferase/mannose-6-phosphate isomerase